MFNLSTLRSPRPPNFLVPAVVLMILAGILGIDNATASIDKPVRWRSSPLKNLAGEPLPAATSYEVWLTETGRTEYLAASVNDTTYTLRAAPGVTYQVRVRGVSAQGLKSSFSEMSAPYKSPAASATPPALSAAFGPAYPNPFHARTTILYVVPEDLSADAPLAMEIYDVHGRLLRVFELDRGPGSHEVPWDGRDGRGAPVPAGLYLARFVCGPYTARAKLTLIP